MQNFSKIGKSVLTRALGLQKNYTEIEENKEYVIDRDVSGCNGCKYYKAMQASEPSDTLYKSALEHCQNCPSKIMCEKITYKKIYHNETNRFGYQPRLKLNAIKLLLSYHMLEFDKNGFVKNVDLSQQAELLGCDIKTIHNNNTILKDYGYISYAKTDSRHINLLLPAIDTYFLPASAGGRGYLTLSKLTFQALLNITSLNEMRITLRQLMEQDSIEKMGLTDSEKTYSELRNMLPDYCKRNVIKKFVQNMKIFIVESTDNIVRFTLNACYDAKVAKTEMTNYYKDKLSDFAKSFAEQTVKLNLLELQPEDSMFPDFFDTKSETEKIKYCSFLWSEGDYNDLTNLCMQYNFHLVKQALSSIYKTYYMKANKPQSVGALVRHVIKSNLLAIA